MEIEDDEIASYVWSGVAEIWEIKLISMSHLSDSELFSKTGLIKFLIKLGKINILYEFRDKIISKNELNVYKNN